MIIIDKIFRDASNVDHMISFEDDEKGIIANFFVIFDYNVVLFFGYLIAKKQNQDSMYPSYELKWTAIIENLDNLKELMNKFEEVLKHYYDNDHARKLSGTIYYHIKNFFDTINKKSQCGDSD